MEAVAPRLPFNSLKGKVFVEGGSDIVRPWDSRRLCRLRVHDPLSQHVSSSRDLVTTLKAHCFWGCGTVKRDKGLQVLCWVRPLEK